MNIQKRSIPICVILSIVTFGIYGIYWFVKLTNEVNQLSEDVNATSGGVAFLLKLITCNIYGIYWSYKQGERLDTAKSKRELLTSNQSIVYLILTLFGFEIIAYCLMQNEINNMVA